MKAKVLKMRTEKNGITTRDSAHLANTNGWQQENLEEDTNYACIMMPIPEGWRLVDEKDHRKRGQLKRLITDIHGKYPEWSDISAHFYESWYEAIYIIKEEPEVKEVTMAELEEKYGCKVKIINNIVSPMPH